jgi:Flp pilus assembly protein TadB
MRSVGLVVALSLVGAAGVAVALLGWAQPSPDLSSAVRHLRRPGPSAVEAGSVDGVRSRWFGGVVSALVGQLRGRPRLLPPESALRLTGTTLEAHVTRLVTAALVGLLVPPLTIVVLQRSGLIGLGWYAPAAIGLVAAAVAPWLVHTSTLERASAVRSDLRHQVSAYLDVVTMLLAGNSGYEGALEQASRAGDGRLFAELRHRMRDSATRGATLTDALRRTGTELGLDELEQVAATAALSAAEGAPVARTLAAKCATLRSALAAEQESEARLRTSRLTTPIVGMALIFMALVIYPALSFS